MSLLNSKRKTFVIRLGITFGEHTQKVTNIAKVNYGNFLNSLYWNYYREIGFHLVIPELYKQGYPLTAMQLSNYSPVQRKVNTVAIIAWILHKRYNTELNYATEQAMEIHQKHWKQIKKDLLVYEKYREGEASTFIGMNWPSHLTWQDLAIQEREALREQIARGFIPFSWEMTNGCRGYYYVGWNGSGGYSNIIYPELCPTLEEAQKLANKVATQKYYIIHKLY